MKAQSPNYWTPREFHATLAETQTSPAPREGISSKSHHRGTMAIPVQPIWISAGAGALPGPSISALGKCPPLHLLLPYSSVLCFLLACPLLLQSPAVVNNSPYKLSLF